MNRFLLFVLLLFTLGAAPGSVPISVPVTIGVGTTTTAAFNVPKVVDKTITAQIPCDPTWTIQIGLQFSVNKGATWDCDMVTIPCQGFARKFTGPCTLAGKPLPFLTGIFTITGTHPAHQAGTQARVVFISNQAKTFTATLIFN